MNSNGAAAAEADYDSQWEKIIQGPMQSSLDPYTLANDPDILRHKGWQMPGNLAFPKWNKERLLFHMHEVATQRKALLLQLAANEADMQLLDEVHRRAAEVMAKYNADAARHGDHFRKNL